MALVDPFAYPEDPHTYVHAPSGYTTYHPYKPWLRDEFVFRCVYCLTRETWGSSVSGHAELGADHFEAKSTRSDLVTTYTNLIYVCNDCNRYKLTDPLPLNPLVDPLANHLSVDESGTVTALTPEGAIFVDVLRLNTPGRIRLRQDRFTLLRLKQKYPQDEDADAIYRRAFGYPADLPDLSALNPPGGNANRGSETRSAFARRQRGELPDVY